MGSTYERSFIKGLVWESISFIITFIVVYFIYGNFKTSFMFSIGLTSIKAVFFFIHERIWKKIKWGKIKDKK